MTMSLVLIERWEKPDIRISSPSHPQAERLGEHGGAPVDLVCLAVLLDPRRDWIEAARQVSAPWFEHRFHGRILVHADPPSPRVRGEGLDDLWPGAEYRIAQGEHVRSQPVEQHVLAHGVNPQRRAEQSLAHQ